MIENPMDFSEREVLFNRKLIADYLKFGSVDEVFKAYNYDLPISYPSFQRLLDRWGVVKAAGPNTRFSEILVFFAKLVEERIPLERLYKYMPDAFSVSLATLHRILTYVRRETIRRVGTALVITPQGEQNLILVGNDVSPLPRQNVGKPFDSVTLPMGYSRRTEGRETSILRVLQQEVFSSRVIEKSFPFELLPRNPKPIMFLDIADVRVAVFHLALPLTLSQLESFSSFKIRDLRYMHLTKILAGDENSLFRQGIKEIGRGYARYLHHAADGTGSPVPIVEKSLLNQKLLALAYDYGL